MIHAARHSFATSDLLPTIWQRVVCKDAKRGQMVECGIFIAKYDALVTINMSRCHQSAREMRKGRRRQHQSSPQSSENQENARRTSIRGWTRVDSCSRFRVITDAGEQSCVSLLEAKRSGNADSRQENSGWDLSRANGSTLHDCGSA